MRSEKNTRGSSHTAVVLYDIQIKYCLCSIIFIKANFNNRIIDMFKHIGILKWQNYLAATAKPEGSQIELEEAGKG